MVHSRAETDVLADVKFKFNEAVLPEAVADPRLSVCAGNRRVVWQKRNTPVINMNMRLDTKSLRPDGRGSPSAGLRNRLVVKLLGADLV
jgi:hypothetical protein